MGFRSLLSLSFREQCLLELLSNRLRGTKPCAPAPLKKTMFPIQSIHHIRGGGVDLGRTTETMGLIAQHTATGATASKA